MAEKHIRDRMAEVGARARLLQGAFFDSATGALRWDRGCYSAEVNDKGVIVSITHRPTGGTAEVGSDEALDESYGIANNYSGFGATFVKGKFQSVLVSRFFSKGSGPNRFPTWSGKPKQADLDKAKQLLLAARSAVKVTDNNVVNACTAALEAPLATKRKEAAAKARAKLEESAAALKKKRISLVK